MTTEEQLATFEAGVLLLQHQKARIAALEAELAEARKDGERLDWAIANHDSVLMWRQLANRESIDAARGAK